MSTVSVFSNPIRRRRRRRKSSESRAKRSRAARLGARHRRRRRHRNPESHRERVLAAIRGARHRHHHRRRHRNPVAALSGEMGNVLVPALVGAGGALGLNILLGYAKFLPATLQTGYGRAGVQIAGALAIGAFGPKIGLSRRTSTAIAAGISVIALYDVASTLIASKFPNVNLGEVYGSIPSSLMLPHAQPGGFGEVFTAQNALVPVSATESGASPNTFG